MATMLCVPNARPLEVQVDVRVFPLPARVLPEQPRIGVPPSTKLTVPVGALPVTDAVNVMLAPCEDGLCELVSAVLMLAVPTF